jgi:hypothetical protein
MKKLILNLFMVFTAIMISSCSSDPAVGQWAPDNDTSGNSIYQLNNDGSAELIINEDDGSIHLDGKWDYKKDSEKIINIKFDPSSAEAESVNEIGEALLKAMARKFASHELTFTISDDGQKLTADGGNGYFVKL